SFPLGNPFPTSSGAVRGRKRRKVATPVGGAGEDRAAQKPKSGILLLRRGGAHLHLHFGEPGLHHADLLCGRIREIDDAAPAREAIVDADLDRLAVRDVGDLELGPEGMVIACRGELVHVEGLAARGLAALEFLTVVGRFACGRIGRRRGGGGGCSRLREQRRRDRGGARLTRGGRVRNERSADRANDETEGTLTDLRHGSPPARTARGSKATYRFAVRSTNPATTIT